MGVLTPALVLRFLGVLSVTQPLAWCFLAHSSFLGTAVRDVPALKAAANFPMAAANGNGVAGLSCSVASEKHVSAGAFRAEDGIAPLLSCIAPSKTIEMHALTKEMEARGEKVISLCVGEPDFAPPQEVIEATARAAQEGRTKYTGVTGEMRLRTAIAEDLRRRKGVDYKPSEIVVSNGAKQSIYQAVLATVRPGDEVIIPAPYWPSYPEIVRMAGGTPVIVETTVEEGYLLSPEKLAAAITPCSRMLIFCNPSNPTGAVHSKELCERLAQTILASPAADKLWVMSDEIYERLTYYCEHACFATLPGMKERTLLINGFSKSHAMTGYRVGYLAGPAPVIKAVTTIQGQITSCASAISQEAALAALSAPEASLQKGFSEMKKKRDFVLERLRRIPGVRICTPDGAFYVLPEISAFFGKSAQASGENGAAASKVIKDADELCVHFLKNHGVALVSGSGFGAPNTVRISYATGMADLETAMTEFETCLLALQ